MPRSTAVHVLRCSVVALLFLVSALAFAGDNAEPKITAIHFVSFKTMEETAGPEKGAVAAIPAKPEEKAAGPAKETSVTKKAVTVKFRLSLEGENLPSDVKQFRDLELYTQDPAQSVTVDKDSIAGDVKEILLSGSAKAGTKIARIKIMTSNPAQSVDTHDDFVITITENPPKPQLEKFQVKLEHVKNKEFPNVHTAILTKEGGESSCGFTENPHKMSIDLLPSGATDINVLQPTSDRVQLRFIAAADYVPDGVVATVYDGTDLDTRKVHCIGEIRKTPSDPNKPKITRAEIVFINRSHGVGRLRIFGEGFGDFDPPPVAVDDYLWNCIEQFHIRGTDRYSLDAEQQEFEDFEQRLAACKHMLNAEYKEGVRQNVLDAGCALEGKTSQDSPNCPVPKVKKKRNGEIEIPDEPSLRRQMEYAKATPADLLDLQNAGSSKNEILKKWQTWQAQMREGVSVSVHSRNPDIQVETVEVINANDKMLDVYFEFTRYRGFSYPFRLESSTVTIRKKVKTIVDTAKDEKATATIQGPKLEIYNVDYDIAPKRDPNLTYKYTIFSENQAGTLLGKGVAENFYVLQLSVVNNAEKKVAIPLSAIDAEIEWRRGVVKTHSHPIGFAQGPPTLPPVPLAAVASTFETYQKVKGLRARLFNGLDATTTIATALVPFTGPSLKDAEVFFSGGFVPGLRKAFGDPSSQQLQNLTALSWESSETLPAKGGSIEKLIYIPRRSPQFQATGLTQAAKLEIADILGLEVTGFEVTESEAKSATPASKSPSKQSSDESENKEDTSGSKAPAEKSAPATPPKK